MHRLIGLFLAASVVLAAAPDPASPPAAPVPRMVQQMPPELAEAVLGRSVAGPDGKTLGRLVDVLIDAGGAPQAAVIDFGGFLGVGNRRIAVRWDTLHFAPADPHHPITLDMTIDEIKAAPAYNDPRKPAAVVTPEPAPGAQAGAKPTAPTAAEPAPPAPAPPADPASPSPPH